MEVPGVQYNKTSQRYAKRGRREGEFEEAKVHHKEAAAKLNQRKKDIETVMRGGNKQRSVRSRRRRLRRGMRRHCR